ncbi:peptidoglycan DD-metalloendopeptidase family protein [Dokdonella sp. MW10]|uniref:peptidoglycan DD-metalloendopeptidase family protein n=1 Tax=Dokdonella sp. MW10 TaxID=2992926 RepID=UPI003F7ED395
MDKRFVLALGLGTSAIIGTAHAQPGSGATWDSFGPDRASGVFVNITREHLRSQNAYGIAVDPRQRVLVLNEWSEAGNTNFDCAVTRHLPNARLLDMAYTGPEELEGTRRVAADMGSANADFCTSIDVDAQSRAVIAGWGTSDPGISGFVVRLNAAGGYDTTFSTDGKLAINNLTPFLNLSSRLEHVIAVDDKVLACGWVQRGSSRNMMIVRFDAEGRLDTTFRGTGHLEVDFNVAGDRVDGCSRLLVLPDGGIVAGGIVTGADGDQAYGLARLTSTGGFVSAFGNQGRLLIDDGSAIAATPTLSDLAWDPARQRILVGCDLSFSAGVDRSGCVIAVRGANGALDTTFDGDGRKSFRFSSYGLGPPRIQGGTRVKRLLMRDDGSFNVLGTHENTGIDVARFGSHDAATLRIQADGSVVQGGTGAYAADGVQFHTLAEVTQSGVSQGARERTSEVLVDAVRYKGNLLFIADRERYPPNVFDHDGDGNLDEPGPIAPVIASITTEGLFDADFDFDGLDTPSAAPPVIAVPAGYGHYCSVRNRSGGGYGLLRQGVGSDPCQVFLAEDPTRTVERAGLYSLSGLNWVIGTCTGGFITLRSGFGVQPFDVAFADTAGQSNCVFAASPDALPVFSRPYSGSHTGIGNTQSFNHDPYMIPLDVTDYGQTPGSFDACAIDNRGRSRSVGNPNANPSECWFDNSGINEPAVDIAAPSTRMATSTAAGRVSMAVPRHVVNYAPAGMDPYQREVFVRHQIGSGRYAEVFTTYYAHMQDTAVRRNQLVAAGDVLGRIGTTGASSGDHLHMSVVRHRNLTFRPAFEFDFEGGRHDRDASVGAVDPWGWLAPQGFDPWAWRFRDHANDPLLDDAGSLSPRMWISGEAPPLQ